MAFIDDTWLRKAHQALRQTFDVDARTRNEMIQFLFDEGFWDPDKLKWESAVSRFNDNGNPTKESYWKVGEVWALMMRFGRHQLFHAMGESLGYEMRVLPTEARRIELLERLVALQTSHDEHQQELLSELQRLQATPFEVRTPAIPGQRPHFSKAEHGTMPPTSVGRMGCP